MLRMFCSCAVPWLTSTLMLLPSRCMCPATAKTSSDCLMVRVRVEVFDSTGLAGSCPQMPLSPLIRTVLLSPNLFTTSATAAERSQSGPVCPSGQGTSTGAGRSTEYSGFSPESAGARRSWTPLCRAGSLAGVVVHLQHDLAAGGELHAVARRRVGRLAAGRPGRDPVRGAQRLGARQPGAAEALVAGLLVLGVLACAVATCSGLTFVQDRVVRDRWVAGQHGETGREAAGVIGQVKHEAAVVVGAAVGRSRRSCRRGA